MDPVAAPDDPIAAWLRFGLQRHGRVMIVGFRDASIPIDLDRVFVPLYVYADRSRRGVGPDARDDKDGLGHGGAEISFDDALARASDGRTCLALIGDPGAGKTTLLRHLFRRVASGEVTGSVVHLRGLHPVLVRLATITDGELVARGLERIVARIAAEDAYPQAVPALAAHPGQGFVFLLDGLPERRGELYERTLGLLIEVWTRERPGGPALRLETARLVLQPLAYAMHEQDRRELSFAEATALVRTPLSQVPALRAVAPTPERFLDLVRDECGVLMSRDLGRIEFIHLSFQEYLAACHVSGRGLSRALADRAGDPRWEEVILLAMSRPGVFEPFMTRALERDDLDAALLRQCLRETLEILPAPFEAVADRALARLRTSDGKLTRFGRRFSRRPAPSSPTDELRRVFSLTQGYNLPGLVERARSVIHSDDHALRVAARTLVGLEEPEFATPREGHPFMEPATGITFVWIPGGSFLMGSSKTPDWPNYDPEAETDEIPAHRVQLTGFWMSVYPVTNEQYAHFVAETAHAAPDSFTDRRFNEPAQPVVTVTWDDARAFTAWLTTKLAGIVARLPTEAEWEYAARGSNGRRYPWGNEPPPDASRATFGKRFDTGRPAVVGHTPDGKTPLDVHDMAGNVWEWCLDAWADSYAEIKARQVDPCHDGTGGGARVVRGGSWSSGPRALRSAFRRSDLPRHPYRLLGFRVVWGGARPSNAL